jgi:hypothetical protein
MADRVLIISWGETVRGREKHGLEVFDEAVAYYRELEGSGAIESFDTLILEPNGFMDGCFMLRGSHAQLDALAEDTRFRKLMVDASLIVDNLRVTSGYTAAGIEQTMPLYVDAVGRVPQMA